MPDSKRIDLALIHQFISENHDEKSLKEKLLSLGWEKETVSEFIIEFKKVKSAKRQSSGVFYLAIGGFLGLISCILAIVDPFPALHNSFLYGLTSLAILLVFYGLYVFFE